MFRIRRRRVDSPAGVRHHNTTSRYPTIAAMLVTGICATGFLEVPPRVRGQVDFLDRLQSFQLRCCSSHDLVMRTEKAVYMYGGAKLEAAAVRATARSHHSGTQTAIVSAGLAALTLALMPPAAADNALAGSTPVDTPLYIDPIGRPSRRLRTITVSIRLRRLRKPSGSRLVHVRHSSE